MTLRCISSDVCGLQGAVRCMHPSINAAIPVKSSYCRKKTSQCKPGSSLRVPYFFFCNVLKVIGTERWTNKYYVWSVVSSAVTHISNLSERLTWTWTSEYVFPTRGIKTKYEFSRNEEFTAESLSPFLVFFLFWTYLLTLQINQSTSSLPFSCSYTYNLCQCQNLYVTVFSYYEFWNPRNIFLRLNYARTDERSPEY